MLNNLKQKSTLGRTSFRAPHLEGIPGSLDTAQQGSTQLGFFLESFLLLVLSQKFGCSQGQVNQDSPPPGTRCRVREQLDWSQCKCYTFCTVHGSVRASSDLPRAQGTVHRQLLSKNLHEIRNVLPGAIEESTTCNLQDTEGSFHYFDIS